MKLSWIELRREVPHGGVGTGGFTSSTATYKAPEADIETVGSFVRVTINGVSELYGLHLVDRAREFETPKPGQQQAQGKKR